jgi:hypothetical protein
LITVRLDHSISLTKVQAGDSFAASLAGAVVMNGSTLIERAAPVIGTVESTQPIATTNRGETAPGLIRLTLHSITVDGRPVTLQTSSLFARGNPPDQAGNSTDFQLRKGHELTFRLTAPLALFDPNSLADRRYSDSSKPGTGGK